MGGAGPLKVLEQVFKCAAYLRVRVECHIAELVIGKSDGEPDAQLAAGGLRQQPALQSGTDEVKLGLRDRALEPELSVSRVMTDRFCLLRSVKTCR